MGELLRRGFDAQLADRNTKGYDLLVGSPEEPSLWKVQVKTVRAQPWYVSIASFKDKHLDQVTVYVLLGPEDGAKPVRFFIAKNRQLKKYVHRPPGWEQNPDWKQKGFMSMRAVQKYENRWDALRT